MCLYSQHDVIVVVALYDGQKIETSVSSYFYFKIEYISNDNIIVIDY